MLLDGPNAGIRLDFVPTKLNEGLSGFFFGEDEPYFILNILHLGFLILHVETGIKEQKLTYEVLILLLLPSKKFLNFGFSSTPYIGFIWAFRNFNMQILVEIRVLLTFDGDILIWI